MTPELKKRLHALYLVVDESVASDIVVHVTNALAQARLDAIEECAKAVQCDLACDEAYCELNHAAKVIRALKAPREKE